MPGAMVRIVNTATNQAWVSWTDLSGKFDFPALRAGHYRIEAEDLGFAPTSREADLSSASSPALELTLRAATLADVEAQTNPAAAPAKTVRENAKGTPPAPERSAPGGPGGRGQPLPPGVVNALRQGMGQGGFQQVEMSSEGSQADESAGPVKAGPLGEASSSDAFLMSGTVGRGAEAGSALGGMGSFGPGTVYGPGRIGGLAPFGGFPGPAGDGGKAGSYIILQAPEGVLPEGEEGTQAWSDPEAKIRSAQEGRSLC